jgi:hypothetical protein
LTFAKTDDVVKERMQDILCITVMMEVIPPEVEVKEQFRCGSETDMRIFHLSPRDNQEVCVSYELRGGKEDALIDVFDWSGRFMRNIKQKEYTGKSTSQARGNGKCISVLQYKDGAWINTFSKGQRETLTRLSYRELEGKGLVVSFTTCPSHPNKEKNDNPVYPGHDGTSARL